MEVKYAYKVAVGRPKGKNPPGRARQKWENDIKSTLKNRLRS